MILLQGTKISESQNEIVLESIVKGISLITYKANKNFERFIDKGSLDIFLLSQNT